MLETLGMSEYSARNRGVKISERCSKPAGKTREEMMARRIVVPALWLLFSTAATYGVYLVLANPTDKMLANIMALALTVGTPSMYPLCGFVLRRMF